MGYLGSFADAYSNRKTPQGKPIVGEQQIKNEAGGYVYGISPWEHFKRFLILGTEGGTYYASEQKITEQNLDNVIKCIKEDGVRTVDEIVRVSKEGLAPKNTPAIFALALACTHGAPNVKIHAYRHIRNVCRIGTHIFQFCEFVTKMRGWSRGLREGVAGFYTGKTDDQVAYQIVKYQQRNDWKHHDILNLAHPVPATDERSRLYAYIVGKNKEEEIHSPFIRAFEELKKNRNRKFALECIEKYNFPREALPTELLNDIQIWDALFQKMPMTALIRNLGKMSSIGLLKDNLQTEVREACHKITDQRILHRARVHPLQIILALKTYARGQGFRGKLSWTTVPKILDALDEAFHLAFKNVEPTGKNFLLGIDVSGSMTSQIQNSPLSAAEAAGVMAMVTARTEPNYSCQGFAGEFRNLGITPKMNLSQVMERVQDNNFGDTDCALPMMYAYAMKIPVDTFIVYTDNQTWSGQIHPSQALQQYRRKTGIDAKLIVAAFTATNFSIADPKDKGMLDVVGFSADIPAVIREFTLGNL